MLPPAMRPPPCSISRINASEVTDLPEPDSPTIASVSPRSTVSDRLRTALKVRVAAAERDRQIVDREHALRRQGFDKRTGGVR